MKSVIGSHCIPHCGLNTLCAEKSWILTNPRDADGETGVQRACSLPLEAGWGQAWAQETTEQRCSPGVGTHSPNAALCHLRAEAWPGGAWNLPRDSEAMRRRRRRGDSSGCQHSPRLARVQRAEKRWEGSSDPHSLTSPSPSRAPRGPERANYLQDTQLISHWMCVCVCVCVHACAQLCPTLCDPMDCSPPGSSVHGILQTRVLEWSTISYWRRSSLPRDRIHRVSCISCLGRWVLYHCAPWEAQ